MEQKGSGNSLDTVHERDREFALNNEHSEMVEMPNTMECSLIVHIFNTASFEYGMNGLSGFNYQSLKDSIKWSGLKPKYYVNILNNVMNSYIKGIRSKS